MINVITSILTILTRIGELKNKIHPFLFYSLIAGLSLSSAFYYIYLKPSNQQTNVIISVQNKTSKQLDSIFFYLNQLPTKQDIELIEKQFSHIRDTLRLIDSRIRFTNQKIYRLAKNVGNSQEENREILNKLNEMDINYQELIKPWSEYQKKNVKPAPYALTPYESKYGLYESTSF